MKRITLSIFLAASLVFSSLVTFSVNAEENPIPEMKLFKGSIQEIANESQKNKSNEVPYPLTLTSPPYELKNSAILSDYIENQRVKKDIPIIKDLIERKFPSQFSGYYYDAEKGRVTVQITDDSEYLKELIRDSIQNDEKVDFEVTKYSWADIVDAKEKIKQNAQPGTVLALIPDIKNNKLIVVFDAKLEKQERLSISSLFPKSDMLIYTTLSPSALRAETDNTNWGSLIPMGAKIGGNYRPKPDEPDKTIYSVCTGGYYGVNENDKDVLVTSGHCQTAGSVSPWYQPTSATDSIGNFTYRTTSPGDGSYAVSDSGYITLNSNFEGRARVPYPSSSNMAMITGVYISDTVGDTVYMRGANSGTTTSGKIAYANVDIWWGGAGYGYKNNEVLAIGYTSINGDSGGPVLTNYSYNNQLMGWTFDLAGIHTGTLTVKEDLESGIKAGNYKVYEPIWTTFNDLNLSGIYLIAPQ
ncbi:hypothetical protein [Paenibacillus barengoltzii]|jgi:hypothetical protein|uniref:hypothetical protein n=1 Tax=Paenibacillus barengoltzii TaxID=343517 RepID=UPI000A0846AD|nr:hypothetical protein [Paenibacillus barengoltzii]MEC2345295.1 hypothetical protein [Paenibacillus barengoltzii]SME98216.1 hypothetical protein SAMN02744102_00694 [Paenibacillus barengoltzii]